MKRKAKFRVGQFAYRCIFDDYARITKVGENWITFADCRGQRAQYVRPLTAREKGRGEQMKHCLISMLFEFIGGTLFGFGIRGLLKGTAFMKWWGERLTHDDY